MAVEIIGSYENNRKEIQCLAADVKPVDDTAGPVWYRIGAGSTCGELDTKKLWRYSILNINPLTADGWWEV